jgi:hypothetical protein
MKVRVIKTKDDSHLSYKTLSRIEYANALSFYHSNFEVSDAKQFLKHYLSSTRIREEVFANQLSLIDKIPDQWIPLTAGWIARLLTLECVLPEIGSSQFVITRIEDAIKKIPSEKVQAIKDSEIKEKSLSPKKIELLTEIDGVIEDMINGDIYRNGKFSFYSWLKEHDAKACHIHVLINKIETILEEYRLLLESDDEELHEGYSHLTEADIKTRVKFYNSIIEDAKKYIDGAKKNRKPRKKKTVTCDMKLKFFKCKSEDIHLKLVSINPSKILGAQELFVIDTKYRKVTRFVAKNDKGLDIYRTAIINFDEKLSHTYLVGKKKEQYVLTELQNGGKVHKKKILEALSIAPKLSERINEDIILLVSY